jgi:TDG/mug DNA glycosylase family protein
MLADHLRPGLRAVIAGVAPAGPPQTHRRYYAGRGNAFWQLLHDSGLVPERLGPEDDERLPEYGLGLTDLAKSVEPEPDGGTSTHYDVAGLDAKIRAVQPLAVAFVSKTAAQAYARGARLPLPHGWGVTAWDVAGRPGFVLPGPSGANNGMPLPLRIALWRDLADFLETL